MSSPTEQEKVSIEEEGHIEQEEVSIEEEASIEEQEVAIEESSAEQEWITNGIKMVEWLENECCEHYSAIRNDMESQINVCMQVLDSIPLEKRQSENERSMFEYLKGRLLDISLDYKEEAEYHLTQATILDPCNGDAWNSLGNCLTKKGDYRKAKNCFHCARTLGGGITVLCQLAELEMMFAPVAEDPAEHINECLKYAQEALALDDKDARSLHALGAVYLIRFLVTGGWNHDDLLLSLEALEKAEKNDAMKSEHYLQCNCAFVNRFLENYERSLTGFLDSASTEPDSNGARQMQMTIQLLDKLDRLLQGNSDDKSKGNSKGKNKGKSKAKNKGKSKEASLSSLIESLATVDLNPSYNRATINLLTEGLNKGVAVIGRVRCLVKSEIQAPLYYLLCDSDQNSFVLTVFGIQKEAIKQGDQVTLLEPFCKFVDFEWQGKHYQFKSVRVNLLEQVLVNGNALSPDLAIRKSIHPESKA